MQLFHATAVTFNGYGFLFRGPSGSGKSDLAIRAIEAGARLVGDDYVILFAEKGKLMAKAPPAIRGMIEARGTGLLNIPCASGPFTMHCLVDLKKPDQVNRLPEPPTEKVCELSIRRIELNPFQQSAISILKLIALEYYEGKAKIHG